MAAARSFKLDIHQPRVLHPASAAATHFAMMILRSSPASPFGRKVRIAASLLGLAGKIDVRGPISTTLPTACARRIRSEKFRC